ncbi:hypothetical protein HDR66_03735 [bacterium]|nr:hypothetical protein [bacterium]
MTNQFHMNLNRMALLTALLVVGVILCWGPFMKIAASNVVLNGVIIGTTLFGIGLCFVHMFRLVPEYRWARAFFHGRRNAALPPRLLRPLALILRGGGRVPVYVMRDVTEMVLVRFEYSRESIRYITNTLVFLGLLGTFWGLIMTVGGFSELIGGLNFDDETVLTVMQAGLARPLAGMATAFTSSLMGLAGSLTVGFLGLQVELAQNAIYRQVEDYLAARTIVPAGDAKKQG